MENETDGQRIERLLGSRNKAQFARTHGIAGGGSMISQHISGHRPVALEAAIAYARGLGVSLAEISPKQAAVIQDAARETLRSAPAGAQQLKTAPPTLAEALEVLGIELARDMPEEVREDVADALAKLARRRGQERDQRQVQALLQAEPGKRRAAP